MRYLAAHEAPTLLGVPAGTVRRWAHEGRLHPVGLDRNGRPIYRADDAARLAAARVATEHHPCHSDHGERRRSATGVSSDGVLTVTICVWPECDREAAHVTWPLCITHALDIVANVEAAGEPMTPHKAAATERRAQRILRDKATARRNAAARKDQPGWVYYLRINNQIKIGYAADVKRRLRAYPPTAELLAVHPGSRDLEHDMHRRFADHLAHGREWFTPADDLMAHIADVVAEHGNPARHAYRYRAA